MAPDRRLADAFAGRFRRVLWATRLDISLLWPIVILAGAGVFISLVPLPPNDFWWHLRVGEMVVEAGQIPQSNIFSWTLPADAPFTYAAWLGDALLYLFYRWGGLESVITLRTVVTLGSLWFVAVDSRRSSGSWRIGAFALLFALLVSSSNVVVRPQLWSWLVFSVYLSVLRRYSAGHLARTWLLLCPLLMVFWVNAHGAFVLGLALLGLVILGEAIRLLFGGAGKLGWSDVGWLVGIALMTGLVTLINPRGFGILDYVVDLMTSSPVQGLVSEWQPPTPQGMANTAFYLSVLVLLLTLGYSKYRLTPTDTLMLGCFTWLAWSGQRHLVWYGLTVMPIVAQVVAKLPLRAPPLGFRRNSLNTVLACLVFVPVILVQPWFVEKMPLPDTYWSHVLRDQEEGPLLDTATPIAAAQYLATHPGGHLFNEMGYGSYLIWSNPDQAVFIDPRIELYSYEQWLDYVRIGQGMDYNELLEAYGADRILLSVEHQEELAAALGNDGAWREEYEDPYSQIWTRITPAAID